MGEYQHNYQTLSELVAGLPKGISRPKYISVFREAVREGVFTAAPLGATFKVGSFQYKDDMVRVGPEFEQWHKRTLQAFELGKVRRGVAVHADDVRSGAVDFDQVAAQYRQQLAGRGKVKRPRQAKQKGKSKLVPLRTDDQLVAQPTPLNGDVPEERTTAQLVGVGGASATAGDEE